MVRLSGEWRLLPLLQAEASRDRPVLPADGRLEIQVIAREMRLMYDCPWDDFRFNYFRGKNSETAARELVAWAQPQGIKVEFDVRHEGRLDVIYVFLAAR